MKRHHRVCTNLKFEQQLSNLNSSSAKIHAKLQLQGDWINSLPQNCACTRTSLLVVKLNIAELQQELSQIKHQLWIQFQLLQSKSRMYIEMISAEIVWIIQHYVVSISIAFISFPSYHDTFQIQCHTFYKILDCMISRIYTYQDESQTIYIAG